MSETSRNYMRLERLFRGEETIPVLPPSYFTWGNYKENFGYVPGGGTVGEEEWDAIKENCSANWDYEVFMARINDAEKLDNEDKGEESLASVRIAGGSGVSVQDNNRELQSNDKEQTVLAALADYQAFSNMVSSQEDQIQTNAPNADRHSTVQGYSDIETLFNDDVGGTGREGRLIVPQHPSFKTVINPDTAADGANIRNNMDIDGVSGKEELVNELQPGAEPATEPVKKSRFPLDPPLTDAEIRKWVIELDAAKDEILSDVQKGLTTYLTNDCQEFYVKNRRRFMYALGDRFTPEWALKYPEFLP